MPQRILVVENSLEYRALLQRVIEGMGYEACIAERATTAWRLISAAPAALVLLDIKMPPLHGHDFVRFIRQRGCAAPVIAISGYLTPEVLQQLQRLGVRRVIAKPFKIQRLANEIHEAIGGPDA